jgi:hypothetical protein
MRSGGIGPPFLTLALDEGPGKEPPVPIRQEAGWAPEPVWTLWSKEKYLSPARNRTLDFQPVAIQTQVKVTLRPTVSRPVSPGVEPHMGPKTRFLLPSDICSFVDGGRPLWREDGSVIYRSHSQRFASSICCQYLLTIYNITYIVHGRKTFLYIYIYIYIHIYNISVSLGLVQQIMP